MLLYGPFEMIEQRLRPVVGVPKSQCPLRLLLGPDAGGHDDDHAAEVCDLSFRVGKAPGVQHPQGEVGEERMCFLYLVGKKY